MPLSVFKKLNASLNPYNQGYFVSTRCLISIHLISAGGKPDTVFLSGYHCVHNACQSGAEVDPDPSPCYMQTLNAALHIRVVSKQPKKAGEDIPGIFSAKTNSVRKTDER